MTLSDKTAQGDSKQPARTEQASGNQVDTIIAKIESADYAFDLAHDYEGICPCADFKFTDDKGTVYAHSRCWRVSDNGQDLYVWGKHPRLKAIAKALKKQLDDTKWHSHYTIIYGDFK